MSENEKKPEPKSAATKAEEGKAKAANPDAAKAKKGKSAKGGKSSGGKDSPKAEVILSPESLTLDGLEDASKVKIPKIKGPNRFITRWPIF